MNTKLLIGVASAVAIVIAAAALYSGILNARINRLEAAAAKASGAAERAEMTAAGSEGEAAAHRERIAQLESALDEIRTRAAKQDEQIEKSAAARRGTRVGLDRARRTRSVDATPAELCEKLAALGHPCE